MLWVQRALGRKTDQMSSADTSLGVGEREGLSWLCSGWLRAEGNCSLLAKVTQTPCLLLL